MKSFINIVKAYKLLRQFRKVQKLINLNSDYYTLKTHEDIDDVYDEQMKELLEQIERLIRKSF